MGAALIHADGRTDTTKVIHVFRDYANAPTMNRKDKGSDGVEDAPGSGTDYGRVVAKAVMNSWVL